MYFYEKTKGKHGIIESLGKTPTRSFHLATEIFSLFWVDAQMDHFRDIIRFYKDLENLIKRTTQKMTKLQRQNRIVHILELLGV